MDSLIETKSFRLKFLWNCFITLMSGVVFGYTLYKAYYNENPQEAGEVLKELIIEKLISMLREYYPELWDIPLT